jgi:hypothetical protein
VAARYHQARRIVFFLFALAGAGTVRAQSRDTAVIWVRVVDRAGAPIERAEVVIRTRSGTMIQRGVTDTAGAVTLIVNRDSLAEQLLVRRLGFEPRTQAISLPLDRSVTLTVMLAANAQHLDAIQVSERESIRRRIYYIDSASIAHSPRLVQNAWDVLSKLRPDIAYGRDPQNYCPGVQELFVNGKWIPPETVVTNDILQMRETHSGAAATPHLAEGATPLDYGRMATISALSMIKPEHIAEMTFRDCRDKPIAGMHSTSAVFVVLGLDIGFDPATGSYVIKR